MLGFMRYWFIENQKIAGQIGKYIFLIVGENPIEKRKLSLWSGDDEQVCRFAFGKLYQFKSGLTRKQLDIYL